MDRARHLFRSSVIVILLLTLGKVTGLVRAQMTSNAFGTGADFDAFTAANQLPEVFVTLISGGALAAALIPVYSAHLTSSRTRDSLLLANSVLNLVIVTLSGLSILGVILAPWLTATLLVPEFSPELQSLTSELMRIILLQTTLFGISGVLSSLLNANQHFTLPALAPIALDFGYVIGLQILVPTLGIHGLAWGTVVGGVLHISIQFPALRRYKYRYLPALSINLPGMAEVIRLMGPRIVTLGSVQLADLFIIRLTSGLVEGSTSSYFYGYYLMQLPETLFGTAIGIVVFPTMAEHFNKGDIEGLKRITISALKVVWTLTIPAALGLVLLGRPAIIVFLQRGAFSIESTRLVYSVLIFFSLRVVSEATLEILARLFYAQHDTRTPMYVAVGWLVANISLAFLLVDSLGVGGLALASTIAFTLQSGALYILNRRRLGALYEEELVRTFTRTLIGAVAMMLIVQLLKSAIQNEYLLLIIGGSMGALAYFSIIFLTGGKELGFLAKMLKERNNGN